MSVLWFKFSRIHIAMDELQKEQSFIRLFTPESLLSDGKR